MPGSPTKLELPPGLLREWSEFCDRFGRSATKRGELQARGLPSAVDWLGGTTIVPARDGDDVAKCRMLKHVATGARRPAVWCIYRVETLPVHSAAGTVLGQERIPVPLACGAARPEAVTQFPPQARGRANEEWFWCRAWDDALPESDKWGTAPSAAAWIVGVLQGLKLPRELRGR